MSNTHYVMAFDTQAVTRCRHGKNVFFAPMLFWCMFSIQGAHSERVRDGLKYSFGHFLVTPNTLFDHYHYLYATSFSTCIYFEVEVLL